MPRPLKIYVYSVISVGLAGLLASCWLDGLDPAALGWKNLLFFLVLGGLLDMMIVPMEKGGAVSAGFAVFYAALIVLGPVPAACTAAIATLSSDLALRRRVPLYKTLFNVGHTVISLLLAGWVYRGTGGQVGGSLRLPDDLPALVSCAAVVFLMEITAVNLAVALERKAPLRSVWAANARLVLPLDSALAGVGLLMALLYSWQESIFANYTYLFRAVVVLVPAGLLYHASRLSANMRQVYEKTLRTLAALMEAKQEFGQTGVGDRTIVGHGERVAKLAVSLGEELGLSPEQLTNLRYAGYLHDIGKVGVPMELLRKPDRLTLEERERIAAHPEFGYQILRPIEFLTEVAELVRRHHGSADSPLPLAAQALAAAEIYDGLSHSQPYRAAFSPEQLLTRFQEEAGGRFDPGLYRALCRVVERDGHQVAVVREAFHAA